MIVLGAESVAQLNPPVDAYVDNSFRALGGHVLGYAILLWWIIPNIERKTVPLVIYCVMFVLSGIGRLVSLADYGVAPEATSLTMVLELTAPLLLVWQYFAIREVAQRRALVRRPPLSETEPL